MELDPEVDDRYAMHVEGNRFVTPSGCRMPQVCVVTNTPVSERDMVFTHLYWSPPWVALTLLLGGLPLIICYFATRKCCAITFGLSPEVRKKKRIVIAIKILVSLALLGGVILLSMAGPHNKAAETGMLVCLLLFFISVVVVFVGNSTLRIANHRDGLFWIKGFSREYLEQLEL